MSGKVVHFEIPVDEGDRARKFYGETFGWQLVSLPDLSYTMVTTGPSDPEKGPSEPGFINGGVFERTADFPGRSPIIVIDVPSVDEALRKVEAAGGKAVVEKMPVGDMGFAGYFNDTEGNLIGLWENA
jgi:predicted enzyme related to lactoylglutathione lyase